MGFLVLGIHFPPPHTSGLGYFHVKVWIGIIVGEPPVLPCAANCTHFGRLPRFLE